MIGFNPRTRKGCDERNARGGSRYIVSIHAPVKDATLDVSGVILRSCFNPRTRKGCDDFYFPEFAHLSVSIHAPVKDAT